MFTHILLELVLTLMFLGVDWARPYNLFQFPEWSFFNILPFLVRSLPNQRFANVVKALYIENQFNSLKEFIDCEKSSIA